MRRFESGKDPPGVMPGLHACGLVFGLASQAERRRVAPVVAGTVVVVRSREGECGVLTRSDCKSVGQRLDRRHMPGSAPATLPYALPFIAAAAAGMIFSADRPTT